jgi:hypothetical protein
MFNKLFQTLVLLAVFLLGGWLSWRFFAPHSKSVEESTVLLEKIRAVAKLSTVEGQFSEIYSHSEYQGFFSFFWDKKILVRVRATVSAGYDLERLSFETDPATKTVYMNALPEPQLLSIDHTLDYYDISEGIFQSFTPEDYTRINEKAKDLIREQAMKSNLMAEARTQASQLVEMLRFLIEGAGWRLEVRASGTFEKQQ